MARKLHRKWPFLATVLGLAVLAAGLWALSSPLPRLEVAGHRITGEEYLRAMYQARNDVLSDHAAAGLSLTDWEAETALGDPCRLAADRALEILSEYYAVSTLAAERGYLADAGYDALVQELEEFNRRRQEALDAGEKITGLPSFTMDDYLTYRASDLRLQFCNDPANSEYQVTPEEIRQRYEADRDNLYRQPDELELAFLTADAAGDADELEQKFRALATLAEERGGLTPALEEMPELAAFYQEISVTTETYTIYSRSHGDVLACADGLNTGDISQVFRQEGWLCLVECLERTDHQYVPLADVESVVVQSIRESRYDALIAERTEQAEIHGDLQALYRFTAAQLS